MNQSPQSMERADDSIRESVSALMDGEAEELELRRVLSAEHSETVNDSWQRYHLVRDILKESDQGLSFRHLDISQQISIAIADEGKLPQSAQRTWLKPVAGFAVAASVAMGVVFGVQGVKQTIPGAVDSVDSGSMLATNRAYPVVGSSLQASAGSAAQQGVVNYNAQLPDATTGTQALAELEAQQRLEKYLLRHTESAALNNGQGMMPFARVANYVTE